MTRPTPTPTATITIKHKVPNGLRKARLNTQAVKRCHSQDLPFPSFDFHRDGVTVLKLPPDILECVRGLLPAVGVCESGNSGTHAPNVDVATTDVDVNAAAQRLRHVLEPWFHEVLPGIHTTTVCGGNYSLRHLILRNSHATVEQSARKQLPVQKPGAHFHVDQEHSDLVNIWLPLSLSLAEDAEGISDFHFGFLRNKLTGRIMDVGGLRELFSTSSESTRDTAATQRAARSAEFEANQRIVYCENLKWGDAVIFRSGGAKAVVHGSFRFDEYTDAGNPSAIQLRTGKPRISLEWRCQYCDPVSGFGPAHRKQTEVETEGTKPTEASAETGKGKATELEDKG